MINGDVVDDEVIGLVAAPLKFPRVLDDIIADMMQASSSGRSEILLGEYESHPETVATDAVLAEQNAIDVLLDEQEQRNAG